MTIYRASVTMPYLSGLPRDVAMNVWHFAADALAVPGDFLQLLDDLEDFYNEVAVSTTKSVSDFISPIVDRTVQSTIELFEIGVAGPPVVTQSFTLRDADAGAWPNEVALCMSFKGDTAGRPVARQRGRIYIGPLTEDAGEPVLGGRNEPTEIFIDTVAAAGNDMREVYGVGGTSEHIRWVVYSPTGGYGSPVASGWIDNEWDTQRRRQIDATARTTF